MANPEVKEKIVSIEETLLTFLKDKGTSFTTELLYKGEDLTNKPFLIFEKTGSFHENYIKGATFAFQMHAIKYRQLFDVLEDFKKIMQDFEEVDGISEVDLQTDYNFPDDDLKCLRYQLVYDIYYHFDTVYKKERK